MILNVSYYIVHDFVLHYTECSDAEFQCRSTQCVQGSHVCDGDHDCLDASDEMSCHTELLESNFLIVADSRRRNLYQVGLDDGIMVQILPTGKTRHPVAVAYDTFTGFVYWTDSENRTIGRHSLTASSRDVSIVHQFGSTIKLEGLAIDSAQQNLYYCDAGDVGKIGVIKTDGTQNRDLIQEVGMKPHSIVLDLDNRLMYWSDGGNMPSIRRANMDTGADRVELVREERSNLPTALAIDFATRTIFWGEAVTGQIQSANLMGTRKNLLYKNLADSYYGMAVTPNFLFITDETASAVRILDRQSKTLSNQSPAYFGRPSGIIYVAHVYETDRIRPVTTTTPSPTSFLASKSSSTSTLEVDQPTAAAHVGCVNSDTTTIVSVVVVGIVLVTLIIVLTKCAQKKRSKSPSVNAATNNLLDQPAVSYAVPAFRNNQIEQTMSSNEDSAANVYDVVTTSDVSPCLEQQTSCSSDVYLRPVSAHEQCCQQSPPEPGGSDESRELCAEVRYTELPSFLSPSAV